MKMISQLTREALRRHQYISTDSSLSTLCHPAPTASVSAPSSPPLQPSPVHPAALQSSAPPPVHSIYSQLMKSHDRMTERHLNRT